MPKSPLTWLAILLISIDLVLVAAFVVSAFGIEIRPIVYRLIDLDAEGSIAGWFSSSKLFVAGFVFASAGFFRRDNSVGHTFYFLWAMAFFFLSADEAVGFHEKITQLLQTVKFLPRFSGNHGIWIPLYALAGIGFIAWIAKPSLRIWRSGNNGIAILFIGIVVFVIGAVFVEILSYGELRETTNQRSYLFQVVLEETIELVGISIILVGAVKTCFERRSRTWSAYPHQGRLFQTQS